MGKKSRLKKGRRQLRQRILDPEITTENNKEIVPHRDSDKFCNLEVASGSGVYVGANLSNVKFIGCTITGNAGSGGHIHKDADVCFYNSEASENAINGFTVSKSSNNSRNKKEVNMSKNDNTNKSNIYLEGNIARNNKGAGYLFDKDAKVTAKRNLSEGNLEGFVVTGTPEIQYLKTILNEVLADVESWKLKSESREVLQSDIDTIRIQLEAREPKKIIIRESLISLRNIADGVATNAIFTGIVAAVGNFS